MTNDTAFCYNWIVQQEEWELRTITVNSWDQQGHLTESVTKFYDIEMQSFTPATRETFLFYTSDSLELHIQQLWNPDLNGGDWDNTQKSYYEYDPEGLVVYIMNWFSSYGDTNWRNGIQEFHSYNADDLKDTIITMYWNTNHDEWFYSYRMRYYYNTDQDVIEYYRDFANNQTGDYTLNERKLYIRNMEANEMEIIDQTYWDGVWSNWRREVDAYNENDQTISTLYQNWNSLNMIWDTTVMDRELFEYMPDGQLSFAITQSYYIIWANGYKYSFEYDENGNSVKFLTQNWNHSAQSWQNIHQCLYPVPQTITNTDEYNLTADHLRVYPNPAIDRVTVNSEMSGPIIINIMNLTGQIIYQDQFTDGNERTILLKGMNNGIYIVQVSNGENVTSSRLIVNSGF